ncbi:hypothetical protein Tco_0595258 [Tanacetum coccineum]
MSSAEAEYIAATGCCAQVLWIKSQLANYDVLYDKVPIFCDNTSAIAISNNPVLHSRTKHIDIRYHFIRDYILKGDIKLHFVPTDLQLADIFTKPLAEPSFTRLVGELGMLNIEKQVQDQIIEEVKEFELDPMEDVTFDQIMDEIDQRNKDAGKAESPYDTKSEIKIIKSFQGSQRSAADDTDVIDITPKDDKGDAYESGLCSMPDDDLDIAIGTLNMDLFSQVCERQDNLDRCPNGIPDDLMALDSYPVVNYLITLPQQSFPDYDRSFDLWSFLDSVLKSLLFSCHPLTLPGLMPFILIQPHQLLDYFCSLDNCSWLGVTDRIVFFEVIARSAIPIRKLSVKNSLGLSCGRGFELFWDIKKEQIFKLKLRPYEDYSIDLICRNCGIRPSDIEERHCSCGKALTWQHRANDGSEDVKFVKGKQSTEGVDVTADDYDQAVQTLHARVVEEFETVLLVRLWSEYLQVDIRFNEVGVHTLFSLALRMKWCRMSMCLERESWTLLQLRAIALLLSQ